MRFFPPRDPRQKREETIGWLFVFLFFLVLALVGLGLFFVGGLYYPPEGGTIWHKVVWGGLVVGGIASILALQALASAFVEWSLGPERFIAIMMAAGALVLLYGWVG
ncbi:hypothetical protein K1T73_10280 [Roseovarius sp. SCSIO 43702]|uniref:hypothetical protein n=1 Tax=Roseovarius sp. SCSIO 43702 TaxID=2823043 RepID=UPI001C72B79E|nr:hypothetical protein [Roseovarius sp. SCSIO 43702]QYX55493.1 hypothetical protein K1T73_10280 [Roseovarius sp. SCSIO 43702]